MRRPAGKVKPRIALLATFPAPVHGWIANVNLANPKARWRDGSALNGATMLENYFPTATGVRMRGGSGRYAILGDGSSPTRSIFTYVNGNARKLFGATDDAIYDVTTVLYAEDTFLVDEFGQFMVDDNGDFVVIPGSPDADVDTLGGGNWSVVQFATPGGVFLRLVNGVDTPQVYDGTTWGTAPLITGVTDTTLSYVWAFKQRLFYIQKDTLDAWYLPVDTIGGAATKLPLGGVFTRGGSLLFGASWSLDTGGGLSEQCVFVTTEGEVAVYQGTNPGDAAAWSKVGVYRIGKPRGPKAFIRAGGDLVIATDIGFVPLSQAVQRDIAALSPAAVSYPIEVAWNEVVASHPNTDWQCVIWPTKQMVLVAHPTEGASDLALFVTNARTGAWARYTEWDVLCLEVFGDRLFFGTNDGRMIEGEVTGADQGATYVATCVPLFDPLKAPASLKTGLTARSVLRAPTEVDAKLSLQVDYTVTLPPPPDDISTTTESTWGSAVWGESVWGSETSKVTYHEWRSTPGSGYALSVATQITSGSLSRPDVELVQTDLTYDVGEIGS
jgi:hypothetical protein